MRLWRRLSASFLIISLSVLLAASFCSAEEAAPVDDAELPLLQMGMEVRVNQSYGVDRRNDGYIWGVTAFNSIQSAVNAVPSGGKVLVARGTYMESIRIEKPVIIIAPDGPENTVIQADGTDEVIIRVKDTHMFGTVEINGFTIEGGPKGDMVKNAITFEAANGAIRHSVVQKIRKDHQNSAAISISNGSLVYIEDTTVQDYWKVGIYLGGQGTRGVINGSRIIGEMPGDPTRVQRGVYVGFGASADILFAEISNNDNLSNNPAQLSQGVYVMEWPEGVPQDTGTYVYISDCFIFDNMVGVQAGYVYGEDSSSVTLQRSRLDSNKMGVLATSRCRMSIMDNYFTGRAPNNACGIYVKQPTDVKGPFHAPILDVKNNRFVNYDIGIVAEDSASDPKPLALRANMNYFRNCGVAAIDASNARNVIDATNNWWGSPTGPSGEGEGKGNKVIGRVLFEPWLENDVFNQIFIGD